MRPIGDKKPHVCACCRHGIKNGRARQHRLDRSEAAEHGHEPWEIKDAGMASLRKVKVVCADGCECLECQMADEREADLYDRELGG